MLQLVAEPNNKVINFPANIYDFREAFLKKMPLEISSYVERTAGEGSSHKGNISAYSRFSLIPSVLKGISEIDTKITILGREISSPVLIAPSAWHNLFHVDGEKATSSATERFNSIFCISSFSSQGFDEIRGESERNLSHTWLQLLIHKDKEVMIELIRAAKKSGCSAIVLTVDAPNGCRMCRSKSSQTTQFGIPPALMPLLPQYKNLLSNTLEEYYDLNLSSVSCSWDYIAQLIQVAELPIVLKGIINPEDVKLAKKAGAAGVIVSNHGGRQLDSSISTLQALQKITAQCLPDLNFEIYLDGGIRNGTDIFKALALGAKAVLIGRPAIYGLAVGGEQGVYEILSILKDELSQCMLLTGCENLKSITKEMLVDLG